MGTLKTVEGLELRVVNPSIYYYADNERVSFIFVNEGEDWHGWIVCYDEQPAHRGLYSSLEKAAAAFRNRLETTAVLKNEGKV